MTSDLIRFLADSADEIVRQTEGLSLDERACKLAEACELLSLAARLTRRSTLQDVVLKEAA